MRYVLYLYEVSYIIICQSDPMWLTVTLYNNF